MTDVIQVNATIYLLETSILCACEVPHRHNVSLCHCRLEGSRAPTLCDPSVAKSRHRMGVSAMPDGDW
jgi:hypothetical protein